MNKLHLLPWLLIITLASSPFDADAESGTLHKIDNKTIAPDFNLPDLNELQHKLSDYRGKIVIVNFWATWCPPCRFELPSMEQAYQKLKKHGVIMLAINVGEDADTIFSFTADYPVTFPLLLDRDASITKAFEVIGLPTSYIISPDGQLTYRVVGTREWNDDRVIGQILKLKPSQ
jgi:peroxiredoxin